MTLTTKQQGNLGEVAALKAFLQKGMKVSLPYGDNASYDLIVEDYNGRLLKIQVKSCDSRNADGVYRFSVTRKRINTQGNYKTSYTKNEVDLFLLYAVDIDELYLITYEEAGVSDISIRVTPPKKKGGTLPKMRDDFLFENRFLEIFK